MTPALTAQALLNRLQVPRQDLGQLTFCDGSRETQVDAWAKALPLTQMNYVSTQLYKALPEITRLQTRPESRLAMLESIRLPAQQCIQGLSQIFLNQPLLLPEAARKTATIAQALQKHMSNGYLVVVRELCGEKRQQNPDALAMQAKAIHRATTGLGLLLLRSYQLYAPISGQLWIELHSLYCLAEMLRLLEVPVEDPLSGHQQVRTIEQAYLRILLLACARPNQLRQDEVLSTYYALESLCSDVRLLDFDARRQDNLFAVMLDSNLPPMYKSRLPASMGHELRELNTSALAKKLEEQAQAKIQNPESSISRNARDLSSALTEHLIHTWNILAQRSFERRSVTGALEVTVGLSNIHFYTAGRVPFHIFLNHTNNVGGGPSNDKEALFQKRGIKLKPDAAGPLADDPWGDAFDVSGNALAGAHLPTINIERNIRQLQQQEYRGKHPIYKVPMLDTSPGGYCLEWENEIPVQVKAGELLGLREEGRQKWNIGVVRWVQQAQDSTQLGIQILAPHAVAVAVAILHKTGEYAEYLRALALPSLKAINQPATLITNAISFREYNKVRLYRAPDSAGASQVEQQTLQLTQKTFSTGAFCQFAFREVVSSKPAPDAVDDFDSVWKK